MTKSKETRHPIDVLRDEVLDCAKEFGAARARLAEVADNVTKNESRSGDFAPDLAAPTAFYTLAKDRYEAIQALLNIGEQYGEWDITQFGPYARARAVFDVAYAPID